MKTHWPVVTSQPLSSVQTLVSVHGLGVPALHAPLEHTSLTVQPLLSLHAPPSSFTCTQTPLLASHESAVQTLPSSQLFGWPGWHAPFVQMSPVVQALPSVHTAVLFTFTHLPVVLSQLSLVQGLPSLQPTAVPGLQTPPAPQVSFTVHGLRSSQVPETAAWPHVPLPLLHESAVHTFLSSQSFLPLARHDPLLQTSPRLHASPSLQAVPLNAEFWQLSLPSAPVTQVSEVQGFASLQSAAWVATLQAQVKEPPVHAPTWQLSPVVHGLVSSQGLALLPKTQLPVL